MVRITKTHGPKDFSEKARREYYQKVKQEAMKVERAKRKQKKARKKQHAIEKLNAIKKQKEASKQAEQAKKSAFDIIRRAELADMKVVNRKNGRPFRTPFLHMVVNMKLKGTEEAFIECATTLRHILLNKLSRNYTRQDANDALTMLRAQGVIWEWRSKMTVQEQIDSLVNLVTFKNTI